jgi:hypothetical protein
VSDSTLLVEHLRGQAGYCAGHGSPMYGTLGNQLADDVESGGLTADLLHRWTGGEVGERKLRDDVPALRLFGGLHRLVLAREAAHLALYYPSVGGTADIRGGWPVVHAAMAAHQQELLSGLTRVPQTNEVGRSVPLLGGLRHVAAWSGGRPVRLIEIGASAGLNLRADRLPVGTGLLIDAELPLPAAPAYEVVERLGGDLHPVDPTTAAGRLTLTSYVWPDDGRRLDRLRAAFALAQAVPAEVLRIGAADLVESLELRPGVVTVLWHSVMWQYLDAVERQRALSGVERLAAQATDSALFAYVRFEVEADPVPGRDWHHEVRLSTWPDPDGGGLAGRLIGVAPAHGVPVDWYDAP